GRSACDRGDGRARRVERGPVWEVRRLLPASRREHAQPAGPSPTELDHAIGARQRDRSGHRKDRPPVARMYDGDGHAEPERIAGLYTSEEWNSACETGPSCLGPMAVPVSTTSVHACGFRGTTRVYRNPAAAPITTKSATSAP